MSTVVDISVLWVKPKVRLLNPLWRGYQSCGEITLEGCGEVTKSVARLPVARLPRGEVTRIPMFTESLSTSSYGFWRMQ